MSATFQKPPTTSSTTQTNSQAPQMGAILNDKGVAFRVWAPHADSVSVVGSFNDWKPDSHSMEPEADGKWFLQIDGVKARDEYKFVIANGDRQIERNDPYAREVSNSIGNSIVVDSGYDWEDDNFQMPAWNELVIYELHIGTFNRADEERVGTLDDVLKKLEYLKWLGVNAIELMPVAEFAGDLSWGYNPAHVFAVESAYGGPDALKRFVKAAHQHGLAVILDVVYNHFGPSDLNLWQFDGWSENNKGGIYFYNDWKSSTPWGDSRPDYGRGEVRQFIRDNAMMWVDEYRMDGLRYDMTLFIRSVDGSPERDIPEGWSLFQWINQEIHEKFPQKLIVAEDLRTNSGITLSGEYGGASFDSQWDEAFVHPIRNALTVSDDQYRDMHAVAAAINHKYNIDAFERVVYTESHDEVANGKKRVPSEINEHDAQGWFARRRAALGAALVFTSPGIPMIFQGQEFVQMDWFDDADPIDWDEAGAQDKTMNLYRDLIQLRRNLGGVTSGLLSQSVEVFHINNDAKVIAFRRPGLDDESGDTVVLLNFSNKRWDDYRIGFPRAGSWKVRLDSSSSFYSENFETAGVSEIETNLAPYDWYSYSASLPLPPYSAIIFSRDA